MIYTILESSSVYTLMNMVNNKINEGYVPQGGVAFASVGLKDVYVQAMIKN